MKIVLFADNDKKFLDTRSEFLEDAGYRVIKAYSPAEARLMLASRYVHLAILDWRLNDDTPQDDSGLELARDPAYHSIPKIIMTGFPDHQAARAVLRPAEQKRINVVDYIVKDDSDLMVSAVEDGFKQAVRINWALHFDWAEGLAQSFGTLATLLEPHLPPDLLPERIAELEDLFRRLFFEMQQVTWERLLWVKEGRLALEAYTSTTGNAGSWVVVCGLMPAIPSGDTRHALNAVTLHYRSAANPGGLNLHEARSLPAALREKSEGKIRAAMQTLVQNSLAYTYQHGRTVQPDTTLGEFYRQFVGLDLPLAHFEQLIRNLASQALAQRVLNLTTANGQVMMALPGGYTFSFADPLPGLYNLHHMQLPAILTSSAGGVDADTVLVDAAGHTHLTDFHPSVTAPAGYDLAVLENSLRFGLIEPTSLSEVFEFERQLAYGDTADSDDIDPAYRRAYYAIDELRNLAAADMSNDLRPHLLGVYCLTLQRLAAIPANGNLTPRKVYAYLHALITAGLLAHSLFQSQPVDPPAEKPSPRLRVDEHTRQVFVGEREVKLPPTQYDLLVFLYRNAGKPCSREDLLRLGMGYDKVKPEALKSKQYDGQIYTTMGRLRKSIEPDLKHPRYVIGEGQGRYKLVLQPEE